MYLAIHPASPSPALTSAVLTAGYQPVPVGTLAEVGTKEPSDGWAGAVLELGDDPSGVINFGAKLRDEYHLPVLVVADRTVTVDLEDQPGFDDFLLTPVDPQELRVRLRRLGAGTVEAASTLTLRYADLELNTATYQATVAGVPRDLTYMEYELLRFLVEHPKRVWSREQILTNVWGYDYFGGSRTVDVHVRRLRAKLGEERASWITTVRSVGYRFG